MSDNKCILCGNSLGKRNVCGKCYDECYDERTSFRQQYIEVMEDIMAEICHHETYGRRAGWLDTMARTTARDYGDRLVQMNLWERNPDGCGSRWWYRKKAANAEGE